MKTNRLLLYWKRMLSISALLMLAHAGILHSQIIFLPQGETCDSHCWKADTSGQTYHSYGDGYADTLFMTKSATDTLMKWGARWSESGMLVFSDTVAHAERMNPPLREVLSGKTIRAQAYVYTQKDCDRLAKLTSCDMFPWMELEKKHKNATYVVIATNKNTGIVFRDGRFLSAVMVGQ